MRDTGWMQDALCAGFDFTDGDPFFPDVPGNGARIQARVAQDICRACDVKDECLAHARRRRIPAGVWGGVLRNQQSPGESLDAVHGTDGSYTRHIRQGEIPCRACRQAHSVARAERQR